MEGVDFLVYGVILHPSAPRQLLTDCGCTFLSRIVEDLLRSCSAVHKLTTAYHLQTNGLTERLNRTLTEMLSMYVSPDHSDWDDVLAWRVPLARRRIGSISELCSCNKANGMNSEILEFLVDYCVNMWYRGQAVGITDTWTKGGR